MSKILNKCALALIFLFIVGTAVPVRAQTLGSTLYTTYQISSNHQTVSWTVCGSTQESEAATVLGISGRLAALAPFWKAVHPQTRIPLLASFMSWMSLAAVAQTELSFMSTRRLTQ